LRVTRGWKRIQSWTVKVEETKLKVGWKRIQSWTVKVMKWPGRKQVGTQGTWLVQSQNQSKSQRKSNNKRRRIPSILELIDLAKKHFAARVKVWIPKGAVNLTEDKLEVSPKLEAGVWLHVGAACTASWTQRDVPSGQLWRSQSGPGDRA
jgi:hypothetical protein